MKKITVFKQGFALENGQPWTPIGVNYYRPFTGWPPQKWKMFQADLTRKDFERLALMGFNCVRVFLTHPSFYTTPGVLKNEGMDAFEKMLELAEEYELRLHPTGPSPWAEPPKWAQTDRYADPDFLEALEEFWKLLATRLKGNGAIFAYDLYNEPAIEWDSPHMRNAWGGPPPDKNASSHEVIEYQKCRDQISVDWTRRQYQAIKGADPTALVSCGLVQWSIPVKLNNVQAYAGFRPSRIMEWQDFMEIHFYPLDPTITFAPGEIASNLSYLDAVVRPIAQIGKPLVIAEFGTIGGGRIGQRQASEQDQVNWCSSLIEHTKNAGLSCGWLNWGMYDAPEAHDISQLTGLLYPNGKSKPWAHTFSRIAKEHANRECTKPLVETIMDYDWEACVTDVEAGNRYRQKYFKAFCDKHEDLIEYLQI